MFFSLSQETGIKNNMNPRFAFADNISRQMVAVK